MTGGVEASLERGRAVVGVVNGPGEPGWLGEVDPEVLRGVSDAISFYKWCEWGG